MAINQLSRTELVYGNDAIKRLKNTHVAVFGLGGVGGNVAEALARSGIGTLDLIDFDRVCMTNLNRQVFATRKTVGQYKAIAAKDRILEISPDTNVNARICFYTPDKKHEFDFASYDYIVDAIDNVTAKLDLIQEAQRLQVPIICAMGCGSRKDPSRLKVTDLYKTSNDPLSRIMRHECKKRGIKKLTVVFSDEDPIRPTKEQLEQMGPSTKKVLGSTAFVPAAAGLLIASYVVNHLTEE